MKDELMVVCEFLVFITLFIIIAPLFFIYTTVEDAFEGMKWK